MTITVYEDDGWEGKYLHLEWFLTLGLMSLLHRIG
jgi:hypothetical protein